jgi:hypothetical protein
VDGRTNRSITRFICVHKIKRFFYLLPLLLREAMRASCRPRPPGLPLHSRLHYKQSSTHVSNYHRHVISLNYQHDIFNQASQCSWCYPADSTSKVAASHSGKQYDVMCKRCMQNSILVLKKSQLYTTTRVNRFNLKMASTPTTQIRGSVAAWISPQQRGWGGWMGRPANRVAVHVSIVSFACRWRSAGRRTSRLAELGRKASS